MEKQYKKIQNYEMVIAGKKRIIPEVTLMLSKTGNNNWIISHDEMDKIVKKYLMEDCQNNELLTLEQVDLFNGVVNKTPRDFYNAFVKMKGVGYDQWLEEKRASGFSDHEDSLIKRYFLSFCK